jgi:hypothetical protein
MKLDLIRKSLYLTVFNETMIMRSVGKRLHEPDAKKKFKKAVFDEIDRLTDLMDQGTITENEILKSIESISNGCKVSFGQAQKPINVLLKIHFYLGKRDDRVAYELHCPLDSFVLGEKLHQHVSLRKMDKEQYMKAQDEIAQQYSPRIKLDEEWDRQHLRDEGLLTDSIEQQQLS